MQKVLSTKLKLDDVERFTAMAKQEGESKAGLLRRLVLDHLNTGGKANTTTPVERLNPITSSKTGLPIEITSTDDGLPLKQSPSSERSLPVYHVDSKGSPEASTKSSTGKGWLLPLTLLALWPKSQPSITVDRKSVFTTQPPQVDEHGLYTFRVGDTVVYSSSPIPFW
ncbi:hypothetical protein ACFLW4_03960 [Chloroflexota bacterium]